MKFTLEKSKRFTRNRVANVYAYNAYVVRYGFFISQNVRRVLHCNARRRASRWRWSAGLNSLESVGGIDRIQPSTENRASNTCATSRPITFYSICAIEHTVLSATDTNPAPIFSVRVVRVVQRETTLVPFRR